MDMFVLMVSQVEWKTEQMKTMFRRVSTLDSVAVVWLLVRFGGDRKEEKVCNLYRKNIHNLRKERREP